MASAGTIPKNPFAVEPQLLESITESVEACLGMCNTRANCVGFSTVPNREPGSITGMIGVHGDVSGFITVNMAEEAALSIIGGLLQEQYERLNPEVLDGVGEVINIVAGGIKQRLAGTTWGFRDVTVPSVIVGQNYQIAYAKGLNYLSVTFEKQDTEAVIFQDLLLHVAISLIQL